jgi:hypothetical protein
VRTKAGPIALGGILAALAVVIMSLGGLIPVATYVCPMLCAMLQFTVLRFCGRRIAWAWYGAVAILSLLLGPDKEAAAVFVFLGYYPILKPKMDRLPMKWLWKGLLFNGATLIMYWLLIRLFGMAQIAAEFSELGTVMTAVMLVLGNVIFFLLDKILDKYAKMGRR